MINAIEDKVCCLLFTTWADPLLLSDAGGCIVLASPALETL